MSWRKIAIKEDKAVQEAVKGTDSFFLPTGHPIASMLLVARAKNEDDHNAPDEIKPETVISSISEIKIEAASRVFKQYSAEVALAFATYRNGREPYCNLTQIAGDAYPTGWQEVAIPIDFGRFPQDRVCGLPAPLYKGGGLQMSITYNFPVDDGDADNAFLTGAANHRYDLYADIMPNLHTDSLKGMKVIEQTKRRHYTTKATGTDLIDMSTDPRRQTRKYLVHAYKAGVREAALISELELVLNGNTTRMSDKWNGWQRLNAEDCDLEYLRKVPTKANSTSDEYWCGIPNVQAMFQAYASGSEDVITTSVGDKVTMATQTANDTGMLFLNSDVIPCSAFLDFDKDARMRNLLGMGEKKIQFRIENAGADGVAQFYEEVVADAELQ